MIRKATREDLPRIIEIYEDVHTMEEMGDLFDVLEENLK